LFDTGPEEDAWERNANRLGVKKEIIDAIVLSHWHRDHSGVSYCAMFGHRANEGYSGGMVRTIKLIKKARAAANKKEPLIVDLHPDRPDFRGFSTPMGLVSLQADPSFNELEAAGGKVEKNADTHTLLENMFLVSGEIPRQTSYERGLRMGMRFMEGKGWTEDTLMKDERFVMCNLKGKTCP
jgi:7,8-dihydropterin-6-yl-methyl-4-(beta-D-ribofuranosyl)aminobenzene 5'-phosphate synthase